MHAVIMLPVMILAFLGAYFSMDSTLAPYPFIRRDLSLSSTLSEALIDIAYQVPYMASPLLAGVLLRPMSRNVYWFAIGATGLLIFASFLIALDLSATKIIGHVLAAICSEALFVCVQLVTAIWANPKSRHFWYGMVTVCIALGGFVSYYFFRFVRTYHSFSIVCASILAMSAIPVLIYVGMYFYDKSKRSTRGAKDFYDRHELGSSAGEAFAGLTGSFWLVGVYALLVHSTSLLFVGFCLPAMEAKYGPHDNELYVNILSISLIFAPLVGSIEDLLKRWPVWLILAPAVTMGCWATLALAPVAMSIPPILLLAIAVGMCAVQEATLFAAVTHIIPPQSVAAGFGLLTAFQNVGICIVQAGVSILFVRFHNYERLLLGMAGIQGIGIVLGLLIFLQNRNSKYFKQIPGRDD
eukprot:GILK01001683.1.p1 GENE.GILK01001683.1~~GILK01001683.1.p1  ORF type:complete len:459 (-),score=58.46 GILK01001683.1:253-1485(-)